MCIIVLFCFILFCFILFCFILFCFILFCYLKLSHLRQKHFQQLLFLFLFLEEKNNPMQLGEESTTAAATTTTTTASGQHNTTASGQLNSTAPFGAQSSTTARAATPRSPFHITTGPRYLTGRPPWPAHDLQHQEGHPYTTVDKKVHPCERNPNNRYGGCGGGKCPAIGTDDQLCLSFFFTGECSAARCRQLHLQRSAEGTLFRFYHVFSLVEPHSKAEKKQHAKAAQARTQGNLAATQRRQQLEKEQAQTQIVKRAGQLASKLDAKNCIALLKVLAPSPAPQHHHHRNEHNKRQRSTSPSQSSTQRSHSS